MEEAFGEPVEVWPDNLPAVNLFISMSTQWRVGMGGATGLDYAALPAVMAMLCIEESERPQVFEDLRIMESAAIVAMGKSK